jgi:hypothetical protein
MTPIPYSAWDAEFRAIIAANWDTVERWALSCRFARHVAGSDQKRFIHLATEAMGRVR